MEIYDLMYSKYALYIYTYLFSNKKLDKEKETRIELRTRMDDAKEQLSMEDDLVRFVTQDMQTEDVVTEGNDDTDK